MILAMETHDADVEHRLDRQTGEIVFLCDSGLADVDEDTRERVEADSERYLVIAPVSSAEGWRVMRGFVNQLPVGEARERLEAALHRGSRFAGSRTRRSAIHRFDKRGSAITSKLCWRQHRRGWKRKGRADWHTRQNSGTG
jgi:hypothetical protein